MSDLASINLIDFNDSPEVNRCTTGTDGSNSKKWKEELDEVSDIVKLLEEETFDFDLSLSPEIGPSKSAKELPKLSDDDEEIFFGPVRYKEACVATAVNEEEKVTEKLKPLSPLTAVEMAQLCQEAFTVSCRIQLATGTGGLAESTLRPVSSPPSSSPALTFSPLDEALSSFSKILPAEKRLSCDENGVVKFQGAQSKESMSTSQAAEKKPLRRSISRLGLNSNHQSRLARSFRQRSTALRGSVQKPPQQEIPESLLSGLSDNNTEDQTAVKSPMMKRFCSEMQEAADVSGNLIIASDESGSFTLNQLTGNRQTPASKIKVVAVSRLPQFNFSKPSQLIQLGSTSSSAVQFTAANSSGPADASKQVRSSLQRSNSLHLVQPHFQFSRQETKVPSSDSTSADNNPHSASKIMSSKLDLIGAAASQRKILVAVHSRPKGSGISQGPVKAVGLIKGTNATVSAQDTTGFQMKATTSAGNATPKKNSGTRASIGGTTPGFISRTRPVSGLPTPSRFKVPEFSRPHYK